MTTDRPPSRSQLDADLARTIRHANIAVVAFFVVALAALVTALFLLASQNNTVERAVTSAVGNECQFFRDLGDAPVMAQTTEIGASLIVDSRNVFIGLQCAGHLIPPSKTLRDLIDKYHLRLIG